MLSGHRRALATLFFTEMWFLGSSLGKLLTGLIAGGFDPANMAAMPGRYLNIALYACGGGVLLLLSRPITRLMGGVK